MDNLIPDRIFSTSFFDNQDFTSLKSQIKLVLNQTQLDYQRNKKDGQLKMKQFILEVLSAVIQEKIHSEEIINFLMEEQLNHESISSIIADVLWFLGIETEGNENMREKLIEMIKDMMNKNLIGVNLLKERLETDLLEGTGIITTKVWNKKIARVNIKTAYN